MKHRKKESESSQLRSEIIQNDSYLKPKGNLVSYTKPKTVDFDIERNSKARGSIRPITVSTDLVRGKNKAVVQTNANIDVSSISYTISQDYLSHRTFSRRSRSESRSNSGKFKTQKEISLSRKNAHFLMLDDMIDKLQAMNYKIKNNNSISNTDNNEDFGAMLDMIKSQSQNNLDNPKDDSSFQGFSADLNFAVENDIDESQAGMYRISELHGFLSQMNIKKLLRKTNYNRRELYVMYVRFKALCAMSPSPLGIDYATFKRGVARLSVEDDLFVKRVYKLIDEDQSDSIEWNEFLTVMSALEKGNRKSQISFFFKIYDLDEDGVISRQDLSQMFLSSSMLGNDETTKDLCDAFVRRVFKVVTGNENSAKLTEQDVNKYLTGEGANEDVWDLFGRSMLKDFTERRNV